MTKYLCCFLIACLVAWQALGSWWIRDARIGQQHLHLARWKRGGGKRAQIPTGVTCFFGLAGNAAPLVSVSVKSPTSDWRHYRNILITQSLNLKRGEDTAVKTPASWKSACQSVEIATDHDLADRWRSGGNITTKSVVTNWLDRCRLEVNLQRLRPTDRSIGISLTLIWLNSGKLTKWLTD